MKSSKNLIYKILLFLIGTTAVMSIFTLVFSLSGNASILSEKYHAHLFEEHDIYNQTQSVLNNAIQNIVNDQIKYSPKSYEEHKEIFDKIINSSSSQMVKTNLDTIRTGLFAYFQGRTYFLPDIQFGQTSGSENSSTASSEQSSQQTLSKIDKINLSAILLYINRNDITDYLTFFKFIYYTNHAIPVFSIIAFLFFVFIASIITNKARIFLKWLKNVMLTSAAVSIFIAIALTVYCTFVMPANIDPIVMSFPFGSNVILSYVRSCILKLSILTGLYGLVLLLIRVGINYVPLIVKQKFLIAIYRYIHKYFSKLKYSRIIVNTSLALILFVFFIYNTNSVLDEFSKNNYGHILSKIAHANTVTEVIAAKDDTIYDINLKVLDKKNNAPVSNLKININGKSSISEKAFNEFLTTDETGTLKSTLDKGTYKLTFIADEFPEQYDIPSPFFFELKESGTKIITVNLEQSSKYDENKWGIVEIEALDSLNKPIPELQLEVIDKVNAPGNPDKVYSYTNSHGIAVFKLNSGSYKIGFTQSGWPKDYEMPANINVTVQPEGVTRYTYRVQKVVEITSNANN